MAIHGPGTSFPTFAEFASDLQGRGPSFLEALASELKGSGQFVARTLAFNGCEFSRLQVSGLRFLFSLFRKKLERKKKLSLSLSSLSLSLFSFPTQNQKKCTLNEEEVAIYDASAELWQLIGVEVEKAAAHCVSGGGRGGRGGRGGSQLAMTTQGAKARFFRALLTAIKARDLCVAAQQALDKGHSVVIGLQSTGEGPLSAVGDGRGGGGGRAAADDDDDDDFLDDDDDFVAGGKSRSKARARRTRSRAPRGTTTTRKRVKREGGGGGDDDEFLEDDDEEIEEEGGGRGRGRGGGGDDDEETMPSIPSSARAIVRSFLLRHFPVEVQEGGGGGGGGGAAGPSSSSSSAAAMAASAGFFGSVSRAARNAGAAVALAFAGGGEDDRGGYLGVEAGARGRNAAADAAAARAPGAAAAAAPPPPAAAAGGGRAAPAPPSYDPVAARARLLELVDDIGLPGNALDVIIDRLGGPDRVAELTGRSSRVIRVTPYPEPGSSAAVEPPRYIRASRSQGITNAHLLTGGGDSASGATVGSRNVAEQRRFMQGLCHVVSFGFFL